MSGTAFEDYLKKQPLEVMFVIFATALFLIILAMIIWWNDDDLSSHLRNIILLVGVIGGAYGIFLASERQKTFSRQIDNAQEQLFNERLGRGAKLLAHDNVTMRRAGIRVLSDLGSASSVKQAELIVHIIHDYLTKHTQNDNDISPSKSYMDIENGYNEKNLMIEVISSLIAQHGLGYNNFSFRDLNLSHLSFDNAIMNSADFSESKFESAKFNYTKLSDTDFGKAQLHRTNFYCAELIRANFVYAKLSNTDFTGANLKYAKFEDQEELSDVRFTGAKLYSCDFRGANLMHAKFSGAKMNGLDCSCANFLFVIGLQQEQVDTIIFQEGFNPMQIDSKLTLPASRAYSYEDNVNNPNIKRFIKSDAPWSEQLVDEWVEKEIAEAEEENRRKTSPTSIL